MYRFIDFRSFTNATLDLERTPVTMLIGRNGSGKSNAIEGIHLLHELMGGARLGDVAEPPANDKIVVRGGISGCVRQGASCFALEHQIAGVGTYSLSIIGAKPAEIFSEWLLPDDGHGSKAIFQAVAAGRRGSGQSKANVPELGIDTEYSVKTSDRTVMSTSKELFNTTSRMRIERFVRQIRPCHFLKPDPGTMRNYVRGDDTDFQTNGANSAARLARMADGGEPGLQAKERIRVFLDRLPEDGVAKLELERTRLGHVIPIICNDAGQEFGAHVLSDGTLHLFAILTALETIPERSILVVEDFENGLHPSVACDVFQHVWETAARRDLRVLATTHDPATMDALTDDQMDAVVLCHWDQESGSSNLVRLVDLPDNYSLARAGRLGEVVKGEKYRSRLDPKYEERRRNVVARRIQELQSRQAERRKREPRA